MCVTVKYFDLLRQGVLCVLGVVHDATECFHTEVGVLEGDARTRNDLVDPLDIHVDRLPDLVDAHVGNLRFGMM